ncbi:DUF3238 domain-containing protein [Mesobacillus thioparans]|uniref:DUF3238 domain-containing protein n=1 Tax=Mesobacillus thioparans TaxID=370439 RepID=UPI0039EE86CF
MELNRQLPLTKQNRVGKFLPLAVLGIAGTLYAMNINRRRKTANSSHSRTLKNIEHGSKDIAIEWEALGDSYRVFRDRELIYEGTEPKFADNFLTPGTLYSYRIDSLMNGEVQQSMRIQTTTSVNHKEKDNVLEDLLITTIVTEGQVSFEWEPIEGVTEYTVHRNGMQLEKVTSCAFTDRGIQDDKTYTYTIKARRPLQRSEQVKWELKSLIANAVGAIKKDSSKRMAADEEFSITKRIGPIQELLDTNREHSFTNGNWQLRYTTFLKEETLKNPNAASGDQYFKGDDRSFDPDSTKYRTRGDVFIDTESQSALLNKNTGLTEAFSVNHEPVESAKASEDGIQLEKVMIDGDSIKFILKHTVGNPLVVSPAIDYVVCGVFYKNNEFDLIGTHDQAPEHEIYLKGPGTDSWLVIHQTHSKGLEMMAGALANHYWRYSSFTS